MATFIRNAAVLLGLLASIADASPRVVSMQMHRRESRNIITKRDTILVDLGNAINTGLYYVNASVGTPPQLVQLQVDTGSSDIWMFGPGSCDTTTSRCLGGEFDPQASTSLTLLNSGGFSISYVTPGSGVQGDYVSDIYSVGGTALSNVTLAVATSAKNVPTGIMGIGFDSDESIVSNGGTPYPNIIDVMVSEGAIGSHAYSLWLDDLTDSVGTVLFGGYDTGKFTGELTVLKIQPDQESGDITSMTVAWTSISVTDSTGAVTPLGKADFPLPAVLDSGTTHTVIPADIYAQLADYFGVVTDQTFGSLVACSIGSSKGSINYGFGGSGGVTISVKYAELAIPIYDDQGNALTFTDGTQACSFGLDPTSDGEPILFGDTFLRSAYVVYDLDNKEIGLAPTNFESTKSNIVEIGSSSGNVGGVSSIASGVTVVQTATAKVPDGLLPSASNSLVATAPTGTGHIKSTAGAAASSTKSGATQSASTGTTKPNAAAGLPSALSLSGLMVLGGSFVMMGFGGALLIFN